MASSFEPARHALRTWGQALPANLEGLEEQVDELSMLVKRFAAIVSDRDVIDDFSPPVEGSFCAHGQIKRN